MNKLFFTFLLTTSILASAQTTFRHRVIIKGEGLPPKDFTLAQIDAMEIKYKMFEIAKKTILDTFIVDKNVNLKKTKEYSKSGVHYQTESNVLTSKESIMEFKKKVDVSKQFFLPKGSHKANLSISGDSILINFWLSNGYYDRTPAEKKTSPYHPDKKYYITLENRQYASFKYANWEISALTIPFKYAFGFTKDAITIDPIFKTDLNINTFVGRRIGKVRYTYDKYEGMAVSKTSITAGAFVGLSSQAVDSASSSLNDNPLKSEIDVPALSYGGGLVFNISDFHLGLFLGWDQGLGTTAKKWNFSNKPWLGFGFGYKLAFLGKQE